MIEPLNAIKRVPNWVQSAVEASYEGILAYVYNTQLIQVYKDRNGQLYTPKPSLARTYPHIYSFCLKKTAEKKQLAQCYVWAGTAKEFEKCVATF